MTSIAIYAVLNGCGQRNVPPVSTASPARWVKDTFPQWVGGGCEGCELYAVDMPDAIDWQTTMATPDEPGEPMTLSGTILKKDGKTPAPGVILYVYHTDHEGLYSPVPNQTAAKRHGHLRGWIKTGADGRYRIRTIRPAPYPDAELAAHVHPTIKEPGLNAYYIDDYEFEGDPFLTKAEVARREQRGGGGVITLTQNADGSWEGRRDIVLGKNIPGYPAGWQ
jgi:protocatechuate 3,4-dioxygenase, beta subunit